MPLQVYRCLVLHEHLDDPVKKKELDDKLKLLNYKNIFPSLILAAFNIKHSYQTTRKTLRLFNKKSSRYQLAPNNLKYSEEKKFRRDFGDKLWLYLDAHNQATTDDERLKALEYLSTLRKVLHYALSHCSLTNGGIRFTNPQELDKFITTLQPLIPKTHWKAKITNISNSLHQKGWKRVLRNIDTTEELKAENKCGRSPTGVVSLTLKFNGIKKSSNALIHCLHIAAIILRANKEPPNIEYFSDIPPSIEIEKHVIAFLHQGKGQIFFGIDKYGKITNIEDLDGAVDVLKDTIYRGEIRPYPYQRNFIFKKSPKKDKNYIRLTISSDRKILYSRKQADKKGRYFIRENGKTIAITYKEAKKYLNIE